MRVLVDSAERDDSANTTPEAYTFTLWSEQGNISRLTLLSATIPKTMDLIDVLSVYVRFDAEVTTQVITLGPFAGGVAIATVIAALQVAIRAVGAPYNLAVVTFNPTSAKVSINAGSGGVVAEFFGVDKKSSRLLGLHQSNFITSLTQVFEAPFVVQFNHPEYLILDLDVGQGSANDLQTDGNSHSYVIPMDVQFGEIKRFTANNDFLQRELVPNLHLYKLRLRWLPPQAYSNTYFSFNGADHQLVFEAQ